MQRYILKWEGFFSWEESWVYLAHLRPLGKGTLEGTSLLKRDLENQFALRKYTILIIFLLKKKDVEQIQDFLFRVEGLKSCHWFSKLQRVYRMKRRDFTFLRRFHEARECSFEERLQKEMEGLISQLRKQSNIFHFFFWISRALFPIIQYISNMPQSATRFKILCRVSFSKIKIRLNWSSWDSHHPC